MPTVRLKPGQFVRVTLSGRRSPSGARVPQIAVQDGPQGKFVYVVEHDKDGKDVAGVRPVTLGDWSPSTARISGRRRGLKPGTA